MKNHLVYLHNTLPVLDVIRDDEYFCIVMESAERGGLEDYIKQFDGGHGLTVAELCDIALIILADPRELHEGEIISSRLKTKKYSSTGGRREIANFGIFKNQVRQITQNNFQH